MENEYNFNYDEVKKRFESAPQINYAPKKFQSLTYKTHFQPRTKSIITKSDVHSIPTKLPRQEKKPSSPKMTVQLHVIHVQQVMPIEQFRVQTQQGFYIMPNLIK